MTRALLALACVALVGVSVGVRAAQDQPKAPPKPLAIAGKWTMTLVMEQGTGTPTLELKQDGEKITGTYTGRYGEFPLQGTIKARVIEFTFNMGADNESIALSFKGEVAADAQTMKGKATMGEMGEASWTAKKEKS